MENPDEISSDEVNELFALTEQLEQSILNFSFTGNGVSGSIETGFIVDREE